MKAQAIINYVKAVIDIHEENKHTGIIVRDLSGAMERLVKATETLKEQEPK